MLRGVASGMLVEQRRTRPAARKGWFDTLMLLILRGRSWDQAGAASQ